jgi:hypothetical protein
MKHLQNKKAKQSEKITPIFEPRCQHGRFGFAAGGVMMHRRRNSAIDPVDRPAAAGFVSGQTRAIVRQWPVRRVTAGCLCC